MKINVYKNQKEVAKTFETDAYDIMYGTVEDVLGILDKLGTNASNDDIFKAISDNRGKLEDLMLDIFPEMTKEDLRHIKLKEMVPFFLELFVYVKNSFSESKN